MGLFSAFLSFHTYGTWVLLAVNMILNAASCYLSVQNGDDLGWVQLVGGAFFAYLVLWYILLIIRVYREYNTVRLGSHSSRLGKFTAYSAPLLVIFLIFWISFGRLIGLRYHDYVVATGCLAQFVFTINLVLMRVIGDYMMWKRPILRSVGKAIREKMPWHRIAPEIKLASRKIEQIVSIRREIGRMQTRTVADDHAQEHQGNVEKYVYATRETTEAPLQEIPGNQEGHSLQNLPHFLRCGCCHDITLTESRQYEAGSIWEQERQEFCSKPPAGHVNGYVPSTYEHFNLHQLCPTCTQLCQEYDYHLHHGGWGKTRLSPESEYLKFRHLGTPELLRNSADTCHLCHLIWDTLNSEQKAALLEADTIIVERWNSQRIDLDALDQLRFIRIVFIDQRLIPHFGGLLRPRRWHKSVRGFQNMLPEIGSEFAHPLRFDIPLENYRSGPLIFPMSKNTGSEETMCLIDKFFAKSQDDDDGGSIDGSELPARMINVSGIDSGKVVLEPRQSILKNWARKSNGRLPYVALSHCWGGKEFLTLKLDNCEEFKRGIATSSLPRSFMEAMEATNKLGIQHIWIDSLCIIQDSASDWKCEADLMASVYSNAKYTFVASSAWDGSEGLFRSQDSVAVSPCLLTMWHVEDDEVYPTYLVPERQSEAATFETEVLLSRWNQRGWCFQERYLSTSTVYFGDTQIFISKGRNLSRQGDKDIRGQFDGDSLWVSKDDSAPWEDNPWLKPQREEKPNKVKKHQEWHERWWHMVHDYSRRDLTKGSDKLPAFAGLAKLFEQTAVRKSVASRRYSPDGGEQNQILEPSKYVFGLWKNLMAADLLWYVDSELHPQRPMPYRAPSWSWASLDSVIFNDLVHFQHNSSGLEVIRVDGNIHNYNGEPGAKLTVKGVLRKACWRRCDPDQRMYFAAKGLVSFKDHEIDGDTDFTELFSPVSVNPAVGPLCHQLLLDPEVPESEGEEPGAAVRAVGWIVPDTEENLPDAVFCLKVVVERSPLDGAKTPSMIRGLVLRPAPTGSNHYFRVGFFELISKYRRYRVGFDTIPMPLPYLPGTEDLGPNTLYAERITDVEWETDPENFFPPDSEEQTLVLL